MPASSVEMKKICLIEDPEQDEVMMVVRRSNAKASAAGRIATGPLLQVPVRALQGPRTLEDRLIPGLFLFAFVGLLAIQAFHALTH